MATTAPSQAREATPNCISPSNLHHVAPQPVSSAPLRLEFLDGLRGLAAFNVLLSHCSAEGALWGPTRLHAITARLYDFNPYSVAIFIVLSGFCLMLPVSRSRDGQLKGGLSAFFRRRARRILPPYYAALLLAILVNAALHHAFPAWHRPARVAELSTASVVSHLLLLHNFSHRQFYNINPVLWTVATEWQIYFVFALALLPIWRRYGAVVAVLAAYVFSIGLCCLAPRGVRTDIMIASPHYLGLFALGMFAAEMLCNPRWQQKRWVQQMPWGVATLVLALLWTQQGRMALRWPYQNWAADSLTGLITICLILYCSQAAMRVDRPRRPVALRILESRPAMALGVFSYSLYLFHHLIIDALVCFSKFVSLSADAGYALFWALGVPLSVGLSYLFHLRFERPFLANAPRRVMPDHAALPAGLVQPKPAREPASSQAGV